MPTKRRERRRGFLSVSRFQFRQEAGDALVNLPFDGRFRGQPVFEEGFVTTGKSEVVILFRGDVARLRKSARLASQSSKTVPWQFVPR